MDNRGLIDEYKTRLSEDELQLNNAKQMIE